MVVVWYGMYGYISGLVKITWFCKIHNTSLASWQPAEFVISVQTLKWRRSLASVWRAREKNEYNVKKTNNGLKRHPMYSFKENYWHVLPVFVCHAPTAPTTKKQLDKLKTREVFLQGKIAELTEERDSLLKELSQCEYCKLLVKLYLTTCEVMGKV